MKNNLKFRHVLALVLALSLLAGAAALAADNRGALTKEEIDSIVNTTTDASQVESPFTRVASVVRSSVVGINNYQMTRNGYYNYYGWGYGFGDRNNQQPQERKYATGSGVVVSAYGHVLTNYHVIEDATRITVTIADSDKEYEATLVTYSEDEDIAVLLVNDLPVQPVELGDSDQLQVGEYAIVIGNPLSELFARTVTVGIVSALDRPITDTTYDSYGRRTKVTNSMIQVDAAINSGNSGGGMFNTLGQLMGIPARKYSGSTSMFSSGASVENIGMCIPINVAKPYIREALEKYAGGTTTVTRSSTSDENRPMLGVTVFSVSTNGVLPNGAIVRSVNEGSNAQRAGIEVGDIIVEVNGTKIASSTELRSYILKCSENDTLTVKVYRLPGLSDAITDNGINPEGLDLEGKDEYYLTLTVTLINDSAA